MEMVSVSMKILIVNKFLYPNGGSETYIFQIGRQLMAMGHEVQYFGMEHEGRCVGNAVSAYTGSMDFHGGSTLSKLTYPVRTIYSREARRKIRLVLDDFQPDVVHLNNFTYQLTPSIIPEIRKWEKETGHPCRIVFTAHDYNLVCPNHMLNNPNTHENCTKCLGGHYMNCMKGKCIHGSTARSAVGSAEAIYWNRRKIYREIDAVICCSAFMKEKMDTNPLFACKTVILHNFVNPDSVKTRSSLPSLTEENAVTAADCPAAAAKTTGSGEDCSADERSPSMKKEESRQGERRYVLYFGRYAREKGVATLLKACQKLAGITFVFAGKGELENEVNVVPNVRNVGFLDGEELSNLISHAAFTVFPSEWLENGPFAVIESIMNGTPVLASNLGGTPEMISEGETGELFEAGNAENLAERILSLYEDEGRLSRYHENCLLTMQGKGTIHFNSLSEYCDKLLHEIYVDSKRTA